jgi:hypothetical protein
MNALDDAGPMVDRDEAIEAFLAELPADPPQGPRSSYAYSRATTGARPIGRGSS